jgi:hypothetical protein
MLRVTLPVITSALLLAACGRTDINSSTNYHRPGTEPAQMKADETACRTHVRREISNSTRDRVDAARADADYTAGAGINSDTNRLRRDLDNASREDAIRRAFQTCMELRGYTRG